MLFQQDILDAIRVLPYPRSGSNHVGGLELLVREIFRPENGDRPSVPNVAILVAASNLDRRHNELESVNIAIRDSGVQLLAVLITQNEGPTAVDVNRIRSIGTQIYLVDRFQALGTVMDEVVDEACREGN